MDKATILKKINPDVVRIVPYEIAHAQNCVSVKLDESELTVLVTSIMDVKNEKLQKDLKALTGYDILLVRAPLDFIQDVLAAVFEVEDNEDELDVDELLTPSKPENEPENEPDSVKKKPTPKPTKKSTPKVQGGPTITDFLLEGLKGNDTGMGLKEFYEMIQKTVPGTKESSVRGRCNNAVANGLLIRAGRGLYKLPEGE